MSAEVKKEKKPLRRVEKAVRKALEKRFTKEAIWGAVAEAVEGATKQTVTVEQSDVVPKPAKKATTTKKAKKAVKPK